MIAEFMCRKCGNILPSSWREDHMKQEHPDFVDDYPSGEVRLYLAGESAAARRVALEADLPEKRDDL